MTQLQPDREFMSALDAALETELAPFGFARNTKKHLVREASMSNQAVQIGVQRGRGHLLNCFAVNLEVLDGTTAADAPCKRRIGSWPYSALDLPNTLLLSPLLHTLLPLFWVALFTDRWWRIPRGKRLRKQTMRSAVNAVSREVRSLISRDA